MHSQLSHGNKEERVIPSAPYLTWFWFGGFFKWEILGGGGLCVCVCSRSRVCQCGVSIGRMIRHLRSFCVFAVMSLRNVLAVLNSRGFDCN